MEAHVPGRCPVHSLALSPTGDCVLCRRALARSAAKASGRSVMLGSLAVVAVCAAAVGSRMLFASMLHTPPEVTPEPPPLAHVRPPAPAPPPIARRPRARWGGTAEPEPSRFAAVDEPAPATDPPTAPVAPVAPDLSAARRRVSITMYSASWCGSCARAEAYLREHHIRFTERDVDASERNSQQLNELNPAHTIPTFVIDEAVLVGFGPASFEAAVDQAALARVRR